MVKKDSFVLRHLANLLPEQWWLDSDPLEPKSHPALIGEDGADLVVIGAGGGRAQLNAPPTALGGEQVRGP